MAHQERVPLITRPSLYPARVRAALLGALGCAVITGAPGVAIRDARADDATTSACVRSYEHAQKLRLQGDLLASRAELRACSRDVCPALVHADCVTWLREVEAAIPSVIVSVRSPAGADRIDARVFIDGALAQERLTGAAIEVRPGQRRFRVEVPGASPVERTVLINTGEKNRLLSIVVGDAPWAPASAPGPSLAPSANDAAGPRAPGEPGLPLVPIALGALGLAAAGAGLALDLGGSAKLDELRSTCAPGCAQADVDATRTQLLVGDVLLGAGVVSVGAAVLLWLTRDAPSAAPAPGSARPASLSVRF